MKSINLFDADDDRAVSPVIGVILMVAITVILAAVIGTFVLGLGEQVGQSTPQASISISDHENSMPVEADEAYFEMEHSGGDDIEASETRIVITNQSNSEQIASLSGNFNESGINVSINGYTGSSFEGETFQTGDTLRINNASGAVGSDVFAKDSKYEITVIDTNTGRQIAKAVVRLK